MSVDVEVGLSDVMVRNTKFRTEFLSFTHDEWRTFTAAIEHGEHRLPGDNPVTRAELHGEIARLHEQVEQLRSALRHPSSRQRVRDAVASVRADGSEPSQHGLEVLESVATGEISEDAAAEALVRHHRQNVKDAIEHVKDTHGGVLRRLGGDAS